VAALAVAFASPAMASTLEDPLHGYVFVNGVPTNTDNGTVSPDAGLNWGFFASPAPQTGTLWLVTVTPDSSPAFATIPISGTLTGTETFRGDWTSGRLADFLGLPNGSPPNDCCGSTFGGTATGFDVDAVSFANITLQDLANSTLNENFEGGLPTGSLIFAFLVEGTGASAVTVDTANSGVLQPTPFAATPIPGAVWLFGTGLFGLAMSGVRYKSKKKIPMTKVVAI
jgi:hypothetical protein